MTITKVLVQGVIDLAILHNDDAIIIDFKTNKTKSEKMLIDHYGMQLDMYIWTDSPEENVLHYHKLTGTPFVPPKWAAHLAFIRPPREE